MKYCVLSLQLSFNVPEFFFVIYTTFILKKSVEPSDFFIILNCDVKCEVWLKLN